MPDWQAGNDVWGIVLWQGGNVCMDLPGPQGRGRTFFVSLHVSQAGAVIAWSGSCGG